MRRCKYKILNNCKSNCYLAFTSNVPSASIQEMNINQLEGLTDFNINPSTFQPINPSTFQPFNHYPFFFKIKQFFNRFFTKIKNLIHFVIYKNSVSNGSNQTIRHFIM